MLMITMTLTQTTIAGPVGSFGTRELAAVPEMPDTAPKSAESVTMTHSLLVHWRAATAGVISMALMRITPTVCNPIMIASTTINDSRRFSFFGEKPRLWQSRCQK